MDLIIIMFTAAIMAIFSVLILIGRGDGLIAGYNTSSKQEKARYNIRRLRVVVGGGLLLLTAELFIASLYQFDFPAPFSWLWPLSFLVTAAFMLLLSSTYCRRNA